MFFHALSLKSLTDAIPVVQVISWTSLLLLSCFCLCSCVEGAWDETRLANCLLTTCSLLLTESQWQQFTEVTLDNSVWQLSKRWTEMLNAILHFSWWRLVLCLDGVSLSQNYSTMGYCNELLSQRINTAPLGINFRGTEQEWSKATNWLNNLDKRTPQK